MPIDDLPILTVSQVRAWRQHVREIHEKIKDLQAEVASLNLKLKAAKIFMSNDSISEFEMEIEEATQKSADSADDEEGHFSMLDAVIEALRHLPKDSKPSTIRDFVVAHHSIFALRLEANPGYFYTVLARLLKRQKIIKNGSGYRLPGDMPE